MNSAYKKSNSIWIQIRIISDGIKSTILIRWSFTKGLNTNHILYTLILNIAQYIETSQSKLCYKKKTKILSH